jgi:hypothetical protein
MSEEEKSPSIKGEIQEKLFCITSIQEGRIVTK